MIITVSTKFYSCIGLYLWGYTFVNTHVYIKGTIKYCKKIFSKDIKIYGAEIR